MVCHNYVWAFRQGCFFHDTNAIETKNAHQPTPENEEFKTNLLPVRIQKECQEKRIKQQRENTKHNDHVKLPNQSKYTEKIAHSQIYVFQYTLESYDSAEMSNFEKRNIKWRAY